MAEEKDKREETERNSGEVVLTASIQRLVFSFVALIFVVMIFIFCSVAWFSHNKQVTATGSEVGLGEADNFNYTAQLEYMNDQEQWESIDEFQYDLLPGQLVIARLRMKNAVSEEKQFRLFFKKAEISYYGLYTYPKQEGTDTIADGYGQPVYWGGDYYTQNGAEQVPFDYHAIDDAAFEQYVSPVSDAIKLMIVPEEAIIGDDDALKEALLAEEPSAETMKQLRELAAAKILTKDTYLSSFGALGTDGLAAARENEWQELAADEMNLSSETLTIAAAAEDAHYYLVLYYDPSARVHTGAEVDGETVYLDNSNAFSMQKLWLTGLSIAEVKEEAGN